MKGGENIMMYGYGYGPGFGLFGGIFMLIFWVIVIWLAVVFVRGNFPCHGRHCNLKGKDEDDAMEILRQRYAKGEISKEEFEEKSQILKK